MVNLNGDDEDAQYCFDYTSNITCEKYDPEHLIGSSARNNFSVMHLNIRSLSKNHDYLVSFLSTIRCTFDVIACSETWLNERSHIDTLNLEGYKLYHKNRLGRTGGGVCMYVNSRLQANVCDNLVLDDEYSDSLFININTDKGKDILIGVIYRPPDSNLTNFMDKFEAILYAANKNNNKCLFLGDFNLDISKSNPNTRSRKLLMNTCDIHEFQTSFQHLDDLLML